MPPEDLKNNNYVQTKFISRSVRLENNIFCVLFVFLGLGVVHILCYRKMGRRERDKNITWHIILYTPF